MTWRPLFLILIFLLPGLSQVVVITNYKIRQTEYELSCVNKTKPDLDCHGKCKMQKELNALEENSSGQDKLPILPKCKEVVQFFIVNAVNVKSNELVVSKIVTPSTKMNTIERFLESVFQPPEIKA